MNADGLEVPHNGEAIGEIVARGDMVMEGYWRQPEATRVAMEGGWFHTGDVATVDSDNYVQIVDRKKEIIVSGGENISSLEVEKVLFAHPAVYEAAVIPVPHPTWGEVPKALIVLKPGMNAAEEELLEFCRSRLAHYKCPHSVEFLESLPKTGTGKILKRELRRKYWAAQNSAVSSPRESYAAREGARYQLRQRRRAQDLYPPCVILAVRPGLLNLQRCGQACPFRHQPSQKDSIEVIQWPQLQQAPQPGYPAAVS